VNGGANLFPRLYVALYEAAVAGDQQKVATLYQHVTWISRTIYSVGKDSSRHIKGTKCALKWLGVCDDFVAWPFRRFEGADQTTIGRHMQELTGLLGQREPSGVNSAGRSY
jgi:4-hydroxy-tetrahydrodipicolinate synthase